MKNNKTSLAAIFAIVFVSNSANELQAADPNLINPYIREFERKWTKTTTFVPSFEEPQYEIHKTYNTIYDERNKDKFLSYGITFCSFFDWKRIDINSAVRGLEYLLEEKNIINIWKGASFGKAPIFSFKYDPHYVLTITPKTEHIEVLSPFINPKDQTINRRMPVSYFEANVLKLSNYKTLTEEEKMEIFDSVEILRYEYKTIIKDSSSLTVKDFVIKQHIQ